METEQIFIWLIVVSIIVGVWWARGHVTRWALAQRGWKKFALVFLAVVGARLAFSIITAAIEQLAPWLLL